MLPGDVAQLVIARLDGDRLHERFDHYLSLVKQGIGGFILFGGGLEEVIRAINDLQKASEIPLFIASDLEQGLGQQVKGGTLFPKARAIAEAIDHEDKEDVRLLRDAIYIMAMEARAVGINVILSPVLDVDTNPRNPIICTRSFSSDPEKVAWFGKEFIKGIQHQRTSAVETQSLPDFPIGLSACAKHFPGHGDTEMDSHNALPILKADMERLKKVELMPFLQAIKQGVDMIMVGHLRVDAVDPDMPSSLSEKVIRGLLRRQMGFNGLVLTDAMNMGGIRNYYSEQEACLLAIKSGADILLHPTSAETIIGSLLSNAPGINKRVEESNIRIKAIKQKLKLSQYPVLSRKEWESFIGKHRHQEISRLITEKAVRVIKGRASLVSNSVVVIVDDDNSGAGDFFTDAVREGFPDVNSFYIDRDNLNKEKQEMLNHIKDRDTVIAIFSKIAAWKGRSGLDSSLHDFLTDALAIAKRSTIVSFGSPYILDGLKADNLIAAYWDSELAQRAVARVMIGKGLMHR